MKIYSQRDPQWALNKMGDGTIAQFGCTLTCLAMMTEIRPDVVNDAIKSVNGYSGNFIIWDKLESAVKGIDFIKRVKAYDNADVAANLPCLVEVNGEPIGGTTHWVLYIGDHKIWDPWDGKEKATSAYEPIGYAVVKYTSPNAEPLPPVITDQTIIPQIDNMEVQAIRSKLNDQTNQIAGLKLSEDSYRAQIKALEFKLENCPENSENITKLFKEIHDIIWGKGWGFVKIINLKELVPKNISKSP